MSKDLYIEEVDRIMNELIHEKGMSEDRAYELASERAYPAMRERCMDLLEQSARTSANKLKFFRLAFGAAGGFGERVDAREAKAALDGLLGENKRLTLHWVVEETALPKAAIKVLLNLLWFVYATGTSEVLAIASRMGLDLRMLQAALCASPTQSNFLQYDINSVFEKGDYDEGFTLDLVCKDINLGIALGESTGIDVQVARTVARIHQQALQTYGPKSGEMSVVRLFESASGGPWRFPAPPA